MLEEFLKENRGHEILSKKDLAKGEIGVEIQNDTLHGFYAFPDMGSASTFFEEATIAFATEANDVTVGNIFENATLIQKWLSCIERLMDRMTWRKCGQNDAEFIAAVEKSFEEYDKRRYGMSIKEATAIISDELRQQQFEEQFGISYQEYIYRMAKLGEMMGESMKDGRWTSIQGDN